MLSAAYANNYVALSKTHRAQSVTLSNLLDLPSSWLLHLFSNYFDFHILLNTLPLVCHQFRSLSGDTNVWKSIKIPISVVRRVYADPSKPRSASHATVAVAAAAGVGPPSRYRHRFLLLILILCCVCRHPHYHHHHHHRLLLRVPIPSTIIAPNYQSTPIQKNRDQDRMKRQSHSIYAPLNDDSASWQSVRHHSPIHRYHHLLLLMVLVVVVETQNVQ
mmetsp:Transcript_1807/g.3546  ORF Transcript_1807/g.3546 Transcript_1807/m.3546 type:complete len:218 (-) Transcript_1807:659-1312(-)